MTLKQKIKDLLPDGSYREIAKEIGKSYGTVRDYFAPSKDFSISKPVENELLLSAKKIIEEQSWEGLMIVHGKEYVNKIKAAIAAKDSSSGRRRERKAVAA